MPSPTIAVAFYHVPTHQVRRAVRAMRRDAGPSAPAKLVHYGVATLAHGKDYEDIHVDASLFVDLKDTALTIVMQHPEIGTVVPDAHTRTSDLIMASPTFADVWQYLSKIRRVRCAVVREHVCQGPHRRGGRPAANLTDKNGTAVVWPTARIRGETVAVIPQHRVSDGLLDATRPAVQQIIRSLKQQAWLKGQQWTTRHGVTMTERTNVAPVQPALKKHAAAAAAKADWALTSLTSMYGLDLVSGPDYDAIDKHCAAPCETGPIAVSAPMSSSSMSTTS